MPYAPVVNEADVSRGGGRGGSQVPHEAQDLGGQSGELAVLDKVAQVEQRHLLRDTSEQQADRDTDGAKPDERQRSQEGKSWCLWGSSYELCVRLKKITGVSEPVSSFPQTRTGNLFTQNSFKSL